MREDADSEQQLLNAPTGSILPVRTGRLLAAASPALLPPNMATTYDWRVWHTQGSALLQPVLSTSTAVGAAQQCASWRQAVSLLLLGLAGLTGVQQ